MFKFDFSQLQTHIDAVVSQLDSTLASTMDSLSEIVQTNAKSSKKFKDFTGKLRSGINFKRLNPTTWRVSTDQGYSNYVEFGNNKGGPYIYPKKAKALRFITREGKVVFAKRVRSHGPLPFLKPAADLARSFLPDFVANRILNLITKTHP